MSAVPDEIGGYRIEREIGRGGMGVVYLAHDPRLDRHVAIKALPPEFAQDPVRVERLRREARALAALSHPGIATIHHLCEHEGACYLVLEYVTGPTLFEQLVQRGGDSLLPALDRAREIAAALEAAHDAGVIHRDLKPANIKLPPGRGVKILDFGLATILTNDVDAASPHATTRVTRPGAMLGTVGYMSPEQARGDQVDKRTDIWAFGCVLFEMLTGRMAFPGRSSGDAIAAVLRDDPDWDLMSLRVPPRVRELLRRCLAKDPGQRLRDIGDARLEIEAALDLLKGDSPQGDTKRAQGRIATHNLPRQLSSFVGREREIAEVARLLKASHLLTLTGAGGCGKTRLAMQSAQGLLSEFGDGLWFIDLASVSDPALVLHHAATTIGVAEESGRDLVDILAESIGDGRVLLILDNCEHLIEASAALAEGLLRSCANLRIIATSREPLRIEGEQRFRIPSMSAPLGDDEDDDLGARHEAIRLFRERARLVRPEFELTDENTADVATICRRLDGIPLAIELAAARVHSLPVKALARRLASDFDLLGRGSRGGGSRHETIRATLDWSFGLLNAKESALLRRLSVFRNGLTLDSAEFVVAGDDLLPRERVLDILDALVDKSLVTFEDADADRGPRYGLLEIVRQYAAERLESAGEVDRIRRCHLDYFASLAEQAEPSLLSGRDQGAWLKRLSLEHDNIRAALLHAFEQDELCNRAATMTVHLHRFWYLRGHFTEGRRWLARGIDCSVSGDDLLRARLRSASGILAWMQGDLAAAASDYTQCLDLYRALGDRRREAGILSNLGLLKLKGHDLEQARRYSEESLELYELCGDEQATAMARLNLAAVAVEQQQNDEAREHLLICLDAFESSGDTHRAAMALQDLGEVERRCGRLDDARRSLLRSIALLRQVGEEKGVASSVARLATLVAMGGDKARAVTLFSAAEAIYERLDIAPTAEDRKYVRDGLKSLEASLSPKDFQAARASGGHTRPDLLLADLPDGLSADDSEHRNGSSIQPPL